MSDIYVFDAYGTLFDVNAAARVLADSNRYPQLRTVWPDLSRDWRAKQLEYSWLRTITGDYVSFWQLTEEALDWALEAHGLSAPELRADLLGLYFELPCFPEVPSVLADLGGTQAILSNGSPDMLNAAVKSAGLHGQFDALLSVEDLARFKPDAAVYEMVTTRYACAPGDVVFVSSNGWDIAGAAKFGFRTVWCNRAGAPVDRLFARPAHQIRNLSELSAAVADL